MKKILLLLLIAALLLPGFLTGCNNTPPEETTPEATTPTETTTGDEEIVPPPAITSDNVLNRVIITTGEDESEVYAGKELASYLTKKGVTQGDDGFPISIRIDETLDEDGFSVDATLSGENVGMTIRGGNGRGVLYGVYKFLEEYAGVRYFTPDLEKIPESDIVLTEGNLLTYTPYFEYRNSSWHCISVAEAAAWNVKQGLNSNGGITTEMGGRWNYGPFFVHTLGALTETGGSASTNPCLSLDSPEGQANYEKVITKLREALEADPTINIVSVSQNDENTYCECEHCLASYARYTNNANNYESGGTAGNLLAFVNKVAEELEKDYPDLIIDTLAYNYTQAPPKGIVPRENVCIRVCSIRVCFMHPMTECPDRSVWTRTSNFVTDFTNWGKICERIYVWDYTTNFRYYVPTFANFGSLRQNMRFYHENGVRGMFSQGNGQSVSGEFGELRAYLLAKLMWNPYMSEDEYYAHMDEFLEAYYGAGWEYIRKYIDKTTELASDGCMNIYESPFAAITEAEYRENEDDFEAWWVQAQELAGEERVDAVKRSRVQWRYIRVCLHPNSIAHLALEGDISAYKLRWAENLAYNKPPKEVLPDYFS